jgi:hypothetical protein
MNKNHLLGLLMITSVAAGLILANIGLNLQTDIELSSKKIRERRWVRQPLGDANPGDGKGGFLLALHVKHTADDKNYNTNITDFATNSSIYEYAEAYDTEMQKETPYYERFDVVLKFRANRSQAYDDVNDEWNSSWVRVNFTSPALGITSNVSMDITVIATNNDFMWFHAHLKDVDGGDGAGFQISKGQKVNHTFYFDAYM